MKKQYEKAYNELKAIGVPVIQGDMNDDPDRFRISAETGENWADYWAIGFNETELGLDDFGVNPKINTILDKHGLYAEWYDPGTLIVCEA